MDLLEYVAQLKTGDVILTYSLRANHYTKEVITKITPTGIIRTKEQKSELSSSYDSGGAEKNSPYSPSKWIVNLNDPKEIEKFEKNQLKIKIRNSLFKLSEWQTILDLNKMKNVLTKLMEIEEILKSKP